jgi:hypothetical protein
MRDSSGWWVGVWLVANKVGGLGVTVRCRRLGTDGDAVTRATGAVAGATFLGIPAKGTCCTSVGDAIMRSLSVLICFSDVFVLVCSE